MKKSIVSKYNCFKGIQAFGEAHTDLFPPASFAGALFTEMEQVISRLEGLGAAQTSSTGASIHGTASKEAARQKLEVLLDAINRAAVAIEITVPGFADKFRRPRRGSDSALVNAARAYLTDAAPFKAEFIKFGMAPDFLEQLRSEIEAFEQAVDERNDKSLRRVSATAGLEEEIEQGLKIRSQLDAIVRNSMAHDTALMAEWDSASHIEHPSRKRMNKKSTSPNDKPADPPAGNPEPGKPKGGAVDEQKGD